MSLWQSPDAYQRLRALGIAERIQEALRDFHRADLSRFDSEELQQTLLRTPTARLAARDEAAPATGTLRADVTLEGFAGPHRLNLELGPGLERMGVLVGENGAGKSRLLHALDRLVAGEVWSADHLAGVSEIGHLEANFPGGVFAIAYGAFDPFLVRPSPVRRRRARPSATHQAVYLGLRHGPRLNERLAMRQAVEAARSLGASAQQQASWHRALDWCPGLRRDLPDRDPWVNPHGFKDALSRTSPGRQLALMVLAGAVAYLQPGQLVLFDEPEAHMHPGLLGGLLVAVRELLEERDAYCLVATHSPIPVQAAPRQCVRIVRVEDGHPSVEPATFTTFGENTSRILEQVYEVPPAEQVFQRVLARAWAGDRDAVTAMLDDPSIAVSLALERLADVEP